MADLIDASRHWVRPEDIDARINEALDHPLQLYAGEQPTLKPDGTEVEYSGVEGLPEPEEQPDLDPDDTELEDGPVKDLLGPEDEEAKDKIQKADSTEQTNSIWLRPGSEAAPRTSGTRQQRRSQYQTAELDW